MFSQGIGWTLLAKWLFILSLIVLLLPLIMETLRNLWLNWGWSYPCISSLVVAILAVIAWWAFGGLMWLSTPKSSDKTQTGIPRVGAVGIRNAGHVKMKNVRVVDGDYVYESEKTKNFEGEGLELTGRLSPSDRKLYDRAQAIIAKWRNLPVEEQTKRAATVYEAVAKLKGRADAADQLEREMENRFPETAPPQ